MTIKKGDLVKCYRRYFNGSYAEHYLGFGIIVGEHDIKRISVYWLKKGRTIGHFFDELEIISK